MARKGNNMPLKITPRKTADKRRLKLMMFSPAGVGKTNAILQLPKPYVIDTENGTVHYEDEFYKAGGGIYRTTQMDEVIAAVKDLKTQPHDFLTVALDA